MKFLKGLIGALGLVLIVSAGYADETVGTLPTRTPIAKPTTEAVGGSGAFITAGGATVSVSEKDQPSATSTWVSGGATHSLTTTKGKNENPEAWAQRHKQNVTAMKEALPPDGPPPSATGGLLNDTCYSTWQSQDIGDLFGMRQEVRTSLNPGMQIVGAPPGQGQAGQIALHGVAVSALMVEYPTSGH